MNKLFIFMCMFFVGLSIFFMPAICSAQPVPPPGYEYYCYYVLFPHPHSRCELRPIDYRVVPPPPSHRRYVPGLRPGHHPTPPRHDRRFNHRPHNHGPRR